MRASVLVEKLGIPTASIVCKGFELQGTATAAGLGMPGLPMVVYPGHVNLHSSETIEESVRGEVADQVVKALTVQPQQSRVSPEPGPRDIVHSGTFEEVNRAFLEREWSDGLPVVPPTVEKVEEFLRYTDRRADEVVGVLLPDKRQATIWNIAVNGVMAGCRPEYMPVLVTVVEAMADPRFGQEHLGQTPGTETLITLNGPIIKQLGFNCEQGALRVGFQANTSVGRFWRLYLRNVAGFLPHKTDKGTFGGTWRVVLAENEDALAGIGWPPMSVDQGFQAGDNVVTVSSCTSTDSMASVGAASAENVLDRLAERVTDVQVYFFSTSFGGPGVRPQILMSPLVAEAIARGGYSKDSMRQYLWERARFPASRFHRLRPFYPSMCDAVKEGRLPKEYCQSEDPDRLVHVVRSPADFQITVSGDPARDNCIVCGQSGYIGYPVSKKIALPSDWDRLLREAGGR